MRLSVDSSVLLHVAARGSKLSRAQVAEVESALLRVYPDIAFTIHSVETTGDQNLAISLRDLGKTDFFTKEVDDLVLEGKCRIAIHSAKDLPERIPNGLALVAITQGVDPEDVLVLRENETLRDLPEGALIGSSSARRDGKVKALREDLICVDIRGTIEQRINRVDQRKLDGVVTAKAAMIRLGLVKRCKIVLEGDTAPLQGRLAVVARAGDEEMAEMFSSLDVRDR